MFTSHKNIFFLLFTIFAFYFSYSQINLVQNPSFDIADTCPTATTQMSRCLGWNSYRETPDYFNTCSSVFGMSPPDAAFGFQQPHSGTAYAGIETLDAQVGNNYREIMGTALTANLTIGIKY